MTKKIMTLTIPDSIKLDGGDYDKCGDNMLSPLNVNLPFCLSAFLPFWSEHSERLSSILIL